jgi:ubiquitin-protein ligase
MNGVLIEWPENDSRHWVISIDGPDDSPYRGDVLKLDLVFGDTWPRRLPLLQMLTPVVHPKVVGHAVSFLDHLRGPMLPIRDMIEGIIYELKNPTPEDSFNLQIAEMLRLSPEEFRQAAQNQVSQNINSRFGQ